MRWPSLLRASRFFLVAGAAWLAAGLASLLRGTSGAGIAVSLGEKFVVFSASHSCLFLGSVFVIFGGVYGLLEQRQTRPVPLILGHIHFWLSVVPLAILYRSVYRFPHAADATNGTVNLQGLVQTEMKVFLWSLLALLLGQFVFLANLAMSFFRKSTAAR